MEEDKILSDPEETEVSPEREKPKRHINLHAKRGATL
jgi:hypothetical protein